MNVSLMFVFSGNFELETGLLPRQPAVRLSVKMATKF